ncbi:LysM peptidoglycan-binding domain-containing protein [Mesobacillus subterraneus]|uniref:3D domain-containing protein n=1 Tax=Mesobacillus subterraneus TaxID=285983 RepID=UPI00204245F3|nr:LysM peptidoglycan-binding and 3D domain-containing protein [Mesobacillus subterraneus]MCM3664231.1 LysM peptidoglycan-binding domain-containing protein [Mesobacillus subterraneus]MCM3682259.1 LysM peptidoglycan-binding domain-containing protein [Mesobacillus subterraneus]
MKKSLLSLVAAAAISGAAGAQAQAEEIVVHKGDTLWGLSKEYGVSVESLKKWNNLSSDVIYANDLLEVSPIKYAQVRKGDTLWNIAKAYGVSVEELKTWNKLSSDLIRPGMSLAVYTNMPVEMKAEKAQPAATPVAAPAPAAKQVTATPAPSKPAASSNQITVEATAYTASCEGCSGITKTGVNLKTNPDAKVIAVDPSVIPLGSKVYVEGYGYATAEDIGGAIKGNRIDVFIPTQSGALQWGRKSVKVTILD